MKNKWQQKEQIQRIIREIDDRLVNIQILKGGFIMEPPVLRMMFKHHPDLKMEWDILKNRRDKIARLLWKLP